MEWTFLAIPSRRDFELNELRWWSVWANAKSLGSDAYILNSDKFQESFFNRASFIECGAVTSQVGIAEEVFRLLGVTPILTVNSSCLSVLDKLRASGYRVFETMTVMMANGLRKPTAPEGIEVRQIPVSAAKEWAKAYLLSFYGEEALLPAVTGVARRLVRNRSATLLEARLDGAVAGVLAIFRTRRLAGIYCVGTVPKFRRRGVAGALLDHAAEIATSEGRRLILQTLKSDGVEEFYSRRGFVALYRKSFLRRER